MTGRKKNENLINNLIALNDTIGINCEGMACGKCELHSNDSNINCVYCRIYERLNIIPVYGKPQSLRPEEILKIFIDIYNEWDCYADCNRCLFRDGLCSFHRFK